MREPKSKEGALRQYDAILRSYRRDFAGGGSFGFDFPTMAKITRRTTAA